MIAIDSNLLIYAHRAALTEHRRAQRAIERATRSPKGWGIPLPCVAEFWSVVTHPDSTGVASTGEQAQSFLEVLIADAGAKLWMPGDGFWRRLTQLAADLQVRGPRIFDLQIALTAFENGASEVWTHDRRFATLPGIRVVDPL